MTLARLGRPQRRLWDSNVIIAHLGGESEHREATSAIIQQAQQGEIQIVVSALATIEVAYVRGRGDDISEEIIGDFFARDFVVLAALDARVAAVSRGLVRKYGRELGLGPHDAAHLATAIVQNIPIIEAIDGDLLELDGKEGQPAIAIRHPLYEGPRRFPSMS